jgi:hypothetical protein
MSVLKIFKIVSEDEINQNALCEGCNVKGNLVYLSSIGKKHQFH